MPSTAGHENEGPIKVMMVDDSAIIRGLYRRLLAQDSGVEVVNDAANGQQAVERLGRQHVDVIILDIEMPIMDGLTAIPKLLEVQPSVTIIMASTLTAHNADISLRALEAGAADYIQKPTTNTELSTGQDFRGELLQKVKTLGEVGRKKAAAERPRPKADQAPARKETAEQWKIPQQTDITLRKPGTTRPKLLAIGSSTGGPQALRRFFELLSPDIGIPVVVAQHMPPTFTTILAEHIAKSGEWDCREAVNGDLLKPGLILLAPGGYHMTIDKNIDGQSVAHLNQDPPEHFCRPAVDPMLRSITKSYGASTLCVILTGMGNDGMKGSQGIVEAGGTVFAQDEETSVVWGMPGAVAGAGVCSVIAPLDDLPAHITQFVSRIT